MKRLLLILMLSYSVQLIAQQYDETFNGTGLLIGQSNYDGVNMIDNAKDILYDPATGNIVMWNELGYSGGTLHRYLPNGTLDPTFGVGGNVEIHMELDNRFESVFATDEGYQLAGHVSPEHNVFLPAVLELNYDGSINTDFGIDGLVTEASIDSFIPFHATKGPSGKITLAGWDYDALFADPAAGMARFDDDGNFDEDFGFLTFGVNVHTEFRSAIELSDGRVIGYGHTYNETADSNVGYIACFKDNGDLDISFGDNGIVIPKPDTTDIHNYQFYRAIQGNDGSIYIAGILAMIPDYFLYVVKMDVNGNIMEEYGKNGAVFTKATDITECKQILVTPANEVYLLSIGHPLDDATVETHIFKILADGTPDYSFTNGNPGTFKINIEDAEDIIGAKMVMQTDGKIVVTGSVDGVGGNRDFFVCRITSNSDPMAIHQTPILDFKLSPNPAFSQLSITSEQMINYYEIVATTGQILLQEIIQATQFEVNVFTLPNGIYLLNLTDQAGNVTSQTFIKK
ncbi:MAG: T9SS type A sorting domain-containing protein [Bacteroidetes bacterium]|nr:T9SS type A sorting domain-containing protein [Bacteroidota bacterium]